MKIKQLTENQKKLFKAEIPKYKNFININLERLSASSQNLYARTLAYISIINDQKENTAEQMCLNLTQRILTDNSLKCIIGEDEVTLNNKNIRLSAFKNMIEIYKDEIKKKISPVAYKTVLTTLGQQGFKVRKNIQILKNENEMNKPNTMKTWEEFLELKNEFNKKFKYIQQQYTLTNEVPDYHFLRDCLVCNLYINNIVKIKQLEFNVILRNEYKGLYLHIGDEPPTNNNKNYFWIKLNSTDHKIIINKNKTTGGIKRSLGSEMGFTKIINQKNQKLFPLNKEIVKIILFIKQVFNERIDKPFIKCNNRELNYSSSTWSKMLHRVFRKVDSNITCNIIRKVYNQYIDLENMDEKDTSLIHLMNDLQQKEETKKNLNFEVKTTETLKDLRANLGHLQKKGELTPKTFLDIIRI